MEGQVHDDVHDDVLLELGRLVWAAISLEAVVYPVCQSIRPRGGTGGEIPVGQRIHLARQDLKARPPDPLRTRADRWLVRARDALKERNAVIHLAPGASATSPGPGHAAGAPGLDNPGRPHGEPRPAHGAIPTVTELLPLRRRLEDVRSGWTELVVALGAGGGDAP